MVDTLNSKVSTSGNKELKQDSSSLISDEKLLDLYRAMVKCRMLEQRATELFQQGKLAGHFQRSAGREAAAAAVAIDLTLGDVLSVQTGGCLSALVKGMSPESLLLTLAPGVESTRASLTSAEAERSNVLLAEDQSRQRKLILHRAGDARAKKNGGVVAVFIPPAPSWLDAWREVLSSAAAETLPIVFVHQADEASNSVPTSGRRGKNPEALFQGIPAISVDALDPVAIYRVAFEAILRARQNRGATLLECTSVTRWRVEPVSAMESYLRSKGIEPNQFERQIVEAFNRELDLATRFLEH